MPLIFFFFFSLKRLIPNRIASTIEQQLIKEQTSFRPGKSCISQLLNLIQYIEDGYQEGMITGTAFVDLSAADNTVNHRLLIQKLYNTTKDSTLCGVIQNLLSNRILYMDLNNEKNISLWGLQTNGLPRRSVVVVYPLHDPCLVGGIPNFPLGVHHSFSIHLSSSAVTPSGSVHKSRGDHVVRMWVQLKR